jgi:hypothetical protein
MQAHPTSLGHFWVLVAPARHVLFGYSPRHDSAGVDHLLRYQVKAASTLIPQNGCGRIVPVEPRG